MELFYKMSPRVTRTQIPKLPNWYFAEKIFHVSLLLRYHIFHAKFTHSFVFIVDNCQLYYQILQCKCCETNAHIKKSKAKTTCPVGSIKWKGKTEKAIKKTKQKLILLCYSWGYIDLVDRLIQEIKLICKV